MVLDAHVLTLPPQWDPDLFRRLPALHKRTVSAGWFCVQRAKKLLRKMRSVETVQRKRFSYHIKVCTKDKLVCGTSNRASQGSEVVGRGVYHLS